MSVFGVSVGKNLEQQELVRLINENDKPIGFINLNEWLGGGDAHSWSYFIDAEQQGKGYGKAAAQLAIDILKTVDTQKQIKLATEECNKKAQSLYISLGFKKLDELDGDDLVFGL